MNTNEKGNVIGAVDISVWIECPKCDEGFDAMDRDEEARMGSAVCGNKWKDLGFDYECPSCKHEFVVDELEY